MLNDIGDQTPFLVVQNITDLNNIPFYPHILVTVSVHEETFSNNNNKSKDCISNIHIYTFPALFV